MARNAGPMENPGNCLGMGAGGSPGAATAKARQPYYREWTPGMGCAGVEDGQYPGEHGAGWYTPPQPPNGGAADDERYGRRRLPKSISGKY